MPRLAGYILTERLGGGGGGVVYKGYRKGSDRALAIKVLNRHPGAHEAGSRRAWRELGLLTHVRLPAVPRVIDFGWTDGRLYIATEFVEGLALDEYCERGIARCIGLPADAEVRKAAGSADWAQTASAGTPMPRRDRVELLLRLADAVQSLHEQGVIHRDIKPSNILISPGGQPVIIDLGIATLLAADVLDTLTAEGAPIGTPAFMAPEQARGERDQISTRTAVYGLGATAFLLLTGRTPHDTDTTLHDAVRRVAQEPPRRARDLDPGLPRPLAAVLDKAVSARPEDRYSSGAALGADLRRWLDGQPVLAEEPGLWTAAVLWLGRHPVGATVALCVTIAALVIGGTALSTWWLNFRPDHLRLSADGTEVELVSIGGGMLYRWEESRWGTTAFHAMVDRPPALGGGRMALIGFLGDPRTAGVCAFALDRPDTPLWSTGSAPPDIAMPPHPNFTAPQQFTLHKAYLLADIFPALPGLELVAVHCHFQWSPTVVRVYDLEGRVRYEAWHDGFVDSVHWLSGPGLLVCQGVNSEVLWRGRGEGELDAFPIVLMALRPRDGARPGWVSAPSRNTDKGAVWYKCLLPPEVADVFHQTSTRSSINLAPAVGPDPGWFFSLLLHGPASSPGGEPFLRLTLDAEGTILDRTPSAEYGQHSGPGSDLPDPESVVLGDLPPIIPGGEAFRPANR